MHDDRSRSAAVGGTVRDEPLARDHGESRCSFAGRIVADAGDNRGARHQRAAGPKCAAPRSDSRGWPGCRLRDDFGAHAGHWQQRARDVHLHGAFICRWRDSESAAQRDAHRNGRVRARQEGRSRSGWYRPASSARVQPRASRSFRRVPAAFTDVRFDGSTSTAGLGAVITSYVWDFGDSTSGTGVAPTHQYTAAGTYLVQLTVTDNNGRSNQSAAQGGRRRRQVLGRRRLSVPPIELPAIGQTIFFNATHVHGRRRVIDIVDIDWNFGRRHDAIGRNGIEIVQRLRALHRDSHCHRRSRQTDQVVQTVTVVGSSAVASFTISPTNPVVGTTINFSGSGSNGEGTNPIVRYVWDFGCTVGVNCTKATFTSTSSSAATNIYTQAFTYTVRLTVTDSKGKTATTTQDVTIN